jgi:NADPH2:quinone reductase
MRAIRLHATGGPDALSLEDVPVPAPGPGDILIRHAAVGLNFIDIYQRDGLYPIPLPATLGLEAAGTVEAVGPAVSRFKIGDRVAYCSTLGAYAEANVVKADRAVRVPNAVSFETAAASLLKGLTAEFLVRRLWPLVPGDTVLVQAAAGGVGLILCQWLHASGITVIGCVGSDAKAELARDNGCAHVIVTAREDVAARVRTLTDGAGVKIAYDSVGRETLDGSLASLARRGLLVSFGNASGPPAPVDPLRLSRGGSLYLTRPTLFDYVSSPEELDAAADALFGVLGNGQVTVRIGQTFRLEDTAAAHMALAGRATTGATLLRL